jgi:hypothetical protein
MYSCKKYKNRYGLKVFNIWVSGVGKSRARVRERDCGLKLINYGFEENRCLAEGGCKAY